MLELANVSLIVFYLVKGYILFNTLNWHDACLLKRDQTCLYQKLPVSGSAIGLNTF